MGNYGKSSQTMAKHGIKNMIACGLALEAE
jgi:hypothetical protein